MTLITSYKTKETQRGNRNRQKLKTKRHGNQRESEKKKESGMTQTKGQNINQTEQLIREKKL